MGGLSQLPEDLIHCILSYLETEEAARTSIFCKAWYSAWLNCPSLNFQEKLYRGGCDPKIKKKFLKFIKSTLRRYQDQKIHIEQFILKLSMNDSCSVPDVTDVDEWIRIVVQNGVKRLEIDLRVDSNREYTLPCTIFKAKSLRELSVRGTSELEFGKRIKDKLMFTHLQKLHLSSISIDDAMFQSIIARCTLIENLSVHHCDGLKRIKVTKLYKLKECRVWAFRCQLVEIEAPNLQNLQCYLGYDLKLYKTGNLKFLTLIGCLPSATFLDNFGHKFPRVEHLELTSSWYWFGDGRINLSSPSFKHIVLNPKERLMELNIDAPNMVSLVLRSTKFFPDLSLTNAPSRWMLEISISNHCHLNTDQFGKLKLFLSKSIRSQISLVMRPPPYEVADVRKIPISPVVEVEDVEFYYSHCPTNSNFLDALFLTCHPKAIILSRNHIVASFLYENLIERRNQEFLTIGRETSSWHQDLKEVKLEVCGAAKKEWHPSDWKSLSEAREDIWRIRFRLEWEVTFA